MSRKHIDIDAPTPTPVFVKTILTGELDVPFGGTKPQVRLVQTSAGYEVVFEAHGETRGRWFEHLGQAEKYFERLTGRSSSFEYVTRRTIVRRAAGAALGIVAAALIGMASGPAFAQTATDPACQSEAAHDGPLSLLSACQGLMGELRAHEAARHEGRGAPYPKNTSLAAACAAEDEAFRTGNINIHLECHTLLRAMTENARH